MVESLWKLEQHREKFGFYSRNKTLIFTDSDCKSTKEHNTIAANMYKVGSETINDMSVFEHYLLTFQ